MFDIQQFENDAKENGIRYWVAHEFMGKLGYENWGSFKSVIQKAMASCLQLKIDSDEVFIPFEYNGVKSYKLTRFACFLVAMQADSKKPEVAKAQVSLAAIAEALLNEKIAEQGLERIEERKKLTVAGKMLNGVAQNAGVGTNEFGIFQDAGFRGMYNMSLKSLVTYKGAPEGKTLYDFMGLTELAANTFRLTQTMERIKSNNVRGLSAASNTAKTVGEEVREVMMRSSGVAPENIGIEENIKSLESDIRSVNRKMKKLDNNPKNTKKK